MGSMTIALTISPSNWMKSLQLRQERKLSGMVNDFLTNMFSEDKEYSDLFNDKIRLEKERKEAEKVLINLSTELVIINEKIKDNKLEQDKKDQDSLKVIEMKARMVKASGIYDDIGM